MQALQQPDALALIGKQIAANVQLARVSAGLAVEDVAKELNITFSQQKKYESGINRISAARLHQYSVLFALPVAEFYTGVDQA